MPRRARDEYLRNRRPTKQLRLVDPWAKDEIEDSKKYRWMQKFQPIKEKAKNDKNSKKSN